MKCKDCIRRVKTEDEYMRRIGLGFANANGEEIDFNCLVNEEDANKEIECKEYKLIKEETK